MSHLLNLIYHKRSDRISSLKLLYHKRLDRILMKNLLYHKRIISELYAIYYTNKNFLLWSMRATRFTVVLVWGEGVILLSEQTPHV